MVTFSPLKCSITFVHTGLSLTSGVPTVMFSPSASSRICSSLIFAPGSTGRRSTSSVPPSTARYCLPPLSTIAYFIFFSWSSLRRRPCDTDLDPGLVIALRVDPYAGIRGSRDTNKRMPQHPAGAEADDIIHARRMHVNGWRYERISPKQVKPSGDKQFVS